MNTKPIPIRTLVSTFLLLGCLAGFTPQASSLGLATTQEAPGSSVPADFERRLRNAADLIRDQSALAPSCRAYFQRYGVDLDAWLAPFRPPHVVPRSLGSPFSAPAARARDAICGGTEGRPPFDVLFVDPSCFPKGRTCDLASLLLHELGHLARRDTHDREPFDFFAACRLSACVDPARFR